MICFAASHMVFSVTILCEPVPPPPPKPDPIVTTCVDSRTSETYTVRGEDVLDSGIASSGIWVKFVDTDGVVRMMQGSDAAHVKCKTVLTPRQ